MDLYLDCNATTPLDPRVVEAMQPFWIGRMGNPSSSHRHGRIAKDAVELARGQVATLLNVAPKQIIFTGSGTEANHLAIHGMAATISGVQPTISIGATEHPSMLAAAESLGQSGWRVAQIPVDSSGLVTDESVELISQQHPDILSIMAANNETGVVQRLVPVVEAARQIGAMVHIDATQAAGKIPLDFGQIGVECMTISAHKIYGPKGVGALVVSPSLELSPIISGGGQERGLRAGTENVPAIVGFGMAAELAGAGMERESEQLLRCRSRLESGLGKIDGIEIVAESVERLPNTVMFLVQGIEGETLLLQLDQKGIYLSSGSACRAGKTSASHVLTAMGVTPDLARNALRVSLCRGITREKIDIFLETLRETIFHQRSVANRAAWG